MTGKKAQGTGTNLQLSIFQFQGCNLITLKWIKVCMALRQLYIHVLTITYTTLHVYMHIHSAGTHTDRHTWCLLTSLASASSTSSSTFWTLSYWCKWRCTWILVYVIWTYIHTYTYVLYVHMPKWKTRSMHYTVTHYTCIPANTVLYVHI